MIYARNGTINILLPLRIYYVTRDLTLRAPPLSHLIFSYEAETYYLRSAAIRIQEVISPRNSNSTMSAFSTNNSNTMTLAVPKLRDDRSNWANYEPCIQRALGSKGLWRHVKCYV